MGDQYYSTSTERMAYQSTTSVKKLILSSKEIAMGKKVAELHAYDGSVFDTKSLLVWIERILNHVSGVNATGYEQGSTDEAVPILDFPDTLSYLLHEIICVLNCKCSRGDGPALEILKLLVSYNWEAKIAIILASFVVEYGHHILADSCYMTNLGKLVAMLKHDTLYDGDTMRSKFQNIITLVKDSIKTTRVIANICDCFSSKHITMTEADESMLANVVYLMTSSIVACASEYSVILGKSESAYSNTETWSTTRIEKKITTIRTTLENKLEECTLRIEEKKQIKSYKKLKVMFSSTQVYKDNQKILQAIIKSKGGSSPFSCGPQAETKMGVEALKGKTVLLLISDLEISQEEIMRIKHFYNSRSDLQYEIVWLPIVEKIDEIEEFTEQYLELKRTMPWPSLELPRLIKRGFVRYVTEKWSYSKKSILVSIDIRGRVTNKNVFDMMLTWGNTVYPFSHGTESKLLKQQEWSLKLLVEETTPEMSTWMKEDKLICLFGGGNHVWIEQFIEAAKQFGSEAGKTVEMVYIYNKTTSEGHITTEIRETFTRHSVVVWEKSTSTYFWKRMESMMCSNVKKTTILTEVGSMLVLGHEDSAWGLLSAGTRARVGSMKIAKAKGDLMVTAFKQFSSWSSQVENVGFAMALHENLLELHKQKVHVCVKFEFTSSGVEIIHEIKVCAVCGRVMTEHKFYSCSGRPGPVALHDGPFKRIRRSQME